MGHHLFSHAISSSYYPIWTLSTPASCDWCTVELYFLASFPAPILLRPANGPLSISSIDLASLLYLGPRRPSYNTRPYLQCTTCANR